VISPEREKELAEAYGLDEVPTPRYEDLPDPNKPNSTSGLVSFHKALMLVDRLRTAGFHRYLHDSCAVDQTMDASVWSPEHSFAVQIRTDVPPPVNERITRATGIRPTKDDRDFFIWLANVVAEQWTVLGARKMAPPLIYCGGDHWNRWSKKERIAGAKPFMGVISKYQWNVGQYGAEYGVIVPVGQSIKDSNKVVIKAD
jgi:hypothetical protein